MTAVEKSTGRANTITITNDKGRLSKADIERMVRDAETYKDDDNKARDSINARNALESYCYTMKNGIEQVRFNWKFNKFLFNAEISVLVLSW